MSTLSPERLRELAQQMRDAALGTTGREMHVCVNSGDLADLLQAMEAEGTTAGAIALAVDALKANHKWHEDYDDHGGYSGSELERQNLSALGALAALSSKPPTPGPVTQPWVHAIPMMQQSVLLAAVRGPDGLPKYGGGAKMLLRWYRRCILLSAMDRRALLDPIEPNGGSFTGPSLDGPDDVDHWADRMQVHVNDYLRQLDALPHHWQMHFMHAVEIVGFKHPDTVIRHFWHQVYLRLVHDMHVWPETEQQLDDRLGDSRSGWLKRADPATTA